MTSCALAVLAGGAASGAVLGLSLIQLGAADEIVTLDNLFALKLFKGFAIERIDSLEVEATTDVLEGRESSSVELLVSYTKLEAG